MKAIVFIGPTFPGLNAAQVGPGIRLVPPAKRGDIYLACKHAPDVVALVDGYFDHQLSVWHKEILWAIRQGVRVYGAASMGALRAAELSAFGMRGVGRVYERFASGELEDDDEVAVVHDSAEDGYTSRSDAMVNLRETFAAAVDAGVLSHDEAIALIAAGKALFYADRNAHGIISKAPGLAEGRRSELAAWLHEHGVLDQKRADAVALFDIILRDSEGAGCAGTPPFRLAETNYWNIMRRELDLQWTRRMPRGVVMPKRARTEKV